MGVCIEDVDTPAVETLWLRRASVPLCENMGHHGRRQGARSIPHGRFQRRIKVAQGRHMVWQTEQRRRGRMKHVRARRADPDH